MTKRKVVKEYTKVLGKTIQSVVDLSDETGEAFSFIFSDGSFFTIRGMASGYDIEYDGLYYRFYDSNETLIKSDPDL